MCSTDTFTHPIVLQKTLEEIIKKLFIDVCQSSMRLLTNRARRAFKRQELHKAFYQIFPIESLKDDSESDVDQVFLSRNEVIMELIETTKERLISFCLGCTDDKKFIESLALNKTLFILAKCLTNAYFEKVSMEKALV